MDRDLRARRCPSCRPTGRSTRPPIRSAAAPAGTPRAGTRSRSRSETPGEARHHQPLPRRPASARRRRSARNSGRPSACSRAASTALRTGCAAALLPTVRPAPEVSHHGRVPLDGVPGLPIRDALKPLQRLSPRDPVNRPVAVSAIQSLTVVSSFAATVRELRFGLCWR